MASRQHIILKAALRLVRSYGPSKTTIADIAREAQVGVGTVYLEFRSKDAILGTLSRRAHQAILDAEVAALEGDEPPLSALRQAWTARFEGFVAARRQTHGPELFFCTRCSAIAEAHAHFLEQERALMSAFLRDVLHTGTPEETAGAMQRAYASYAPPLLFGSSVGPTDPSTRPSVDRLRAELPALHALVFHGIV